MAAWSSERHPLLADVFCFAEVAGRVPISLGGPVLEEQDAHLLGLQGGAVHGENRGDCKLTYRFTRWTAAGIRNEGVFIAKRRRTWFRILQ